MSYTSWSVVFGEQPSAAKWNILGANDASFNDGTGIFGLYKNLLAVDSNPYKFSAYRNAAADTGNGALAKITFDTELYDTNGNFATGTYTASVSGFYFLTAKMQVNESHTRAFITLYKNGAEFFRGIDNETAAIARESYNLVELVQAVASDTFEVYAFGSAALTIEVSSQAVMAQFKGFLLSRT